MPKVNGMDARRKARVVALQALFAADVRGDQGRQAVSLDWLTAEDPLSPKALAFSQMLIDGVWERREQLDTLVQRYAPAWPVRQLPMVDRNILRIALFEMLYHSGTPRKTAVNEAVELAKSFGSESSARFINGVLGSAMAGLTMGELTSYQPVPEGR